MKPNEITYTVRTGNKIIKIGGINTLVDLLFAAYEEKGYSVEINGMQCLKKKTDTIY